MWRYGSFYQRGGGSSPGCDSVQAALRLTSSSVASPANPSLSLLSSSGCPHLSSMILRGAEEGSSSCLCELLGCTAPPSGHHDFWHAVWTHFLLSSASLCFHSWSSCSGLVLAGCPSLSRRCILEGSPVWGERHLCNLGCCSGEVLLQTGLCSRWTGWIV